MKMQKFLIRLIVVLVAVSALAVMVKFNVIDNALAQNAKVYANMGGAGDILKTKITVRNNYEYKLDNVAELWLTIPTNVSCKLTVTVGEKNAPFEIVRVLTGDGHGNVYSNVADFPTELEAGERYAIDIWSGNVIIYKLDII